MAKTYNPKKVIVTFNNQPLTGFTDGTFISAKRNKPSYVLVVGADGEVSRVASADRSGNIEVTLMQSSASNDILSAAVKLDELTDLGTGILMIKDLSGRTVLLGAEAWVEQPADAEFGQDKSERKWKILTGVLEMLVGGN